MAIENHEPDQAPTLTKGLTWQRLLFFSLAGISVAFTLLMVVFRFFDPFLATFVVVFGVAAFIVRRGRRGAVISALVLGIVFLAMNAPFLGATLTQPSSTPDFLPALVVLIFDILAIVAAIMILRHRVEPSSGPRNAARVAGGLFVAAGVGSIAASATYDNAVPQGGDMRVVTQDTEFQDESLEAGAGTVGVFVDNKDQTLHTFTIDELDVNLQVPAGVSARVEFDAEPGEYKFYCVPHAGLMEGTLTIK